jgi:hypothetical protein
MSESFAGALKNVNKCTAPLPPNDLHFPPNDLQQPSVEETANQNQGVGQGEISHFSTLCTF